MISDDLYWISSYVLLTVVCLLPWALAKLVHGERQFNELASEIRDVIEGFYLFLAWTAAGQALRMLSHYLHGHTPVLTATALNASRAVAGIFVLFLIAKAIRKQRGLAAWEKNNSSSQSATA